MKNMYIAPGSTVRDLAYELARKFNSPILQTHFSLFPDGESYIRVEEPELVSGSQIIILQSFYYPQEKHLLDLLNLSYTLFEFGASRIDVIVPYLAYARSDRRTLPGESISSQTVIKLLEDAGIHTLYTIDVHNPEIFKFARTMQTKDIYPAIDYADYLHEHGAHPEYVIAPDHGAIPRAQKLAEIMKIPFAALTKVRDPVTKKSKTSLGDVAIHVDEVVLVDDIVSTGSSLIDSANLLYSIGVKKIHVIVSHCVGKNVPTRLQEHINGIIACSVSIPSVLSTISVAKSLQKTIRVLS